MKSKDNYLFLVFGCMKGLKLLLVFLLFGTGRLVTQELKLLNSIQSTGEFTIVSFDTNKEGEVFIIGNFTGNINFGNEKWSLETDSTKQDVFIVKFDRNGDVVWSTNIGNAALRETRMKDEAVAIRVKGNSIYVSCNLASSFTESGDYNNGNPTEMLLVKGLPYHQQRYLYGNRRTDIVIAKYDLTEGKDIYRPVKAFTIGSTGGEDKAIAMDVDDMGYLYLGGIHTGAMNLQPKHLQKKWLPSPDRGVYALWMAKYDMEGDMANQWFFQAVCDTVGKKIEINNLKVGKSGIYVTGVLKGTLNFGKGKLQASVPVYGENPLLAKDAFVAKFIDYKNEVQCAWTRVIGQSGTRGNELLSLAIDEKENVLVGGSIMGKNCKIEGFDEAFNTYGKQAFIAKFDKKGQCKLAHTMPTISIDEDIEESVKPGIPFYPGIHGYFSYRIPSVVTTKNGTILAFAEGRKNSYVDSGDIDIVMRRSLDGGKTWSNLSVIRNDDINRCQNPVPIYIPDINRVVLITCWNYGATGVREAFVTYSDDDGLTWAPHINITASVKHTEWNWYGTGPCHGIIKKRPPFKGRIIVPANHSLLSDKKAFSHVIYSDDNGITWNQGGSVSRSNTGESTVVELSDGKLLLNMRNEDLTTPRYRIEAISNDGGITWEACYENKMLPDPRCQASIFRYENTTNLPSLLLFSNQNQMKARKGLTLKVSRDDGKTWGNKIIYHPSDLYGGYSDITQLVNGDVGILFEDGWQVKDGIRFIVIKREQLMDLIQ